LAVKGVCLHHALARWCDIVVRATTQVNGEMGNSTPYTPKPLKRSSPKVVHVIMSQISTHMQNLVTIPEGVPFPVCAKLRIKDVYLASCFRVLPTAHSPGPEPIFTHNTSNNALPRKDVPFRG